MVIRATASVTMRLGVRVGMGIRVTNGQIRIALSIVVMVRA